MTAVMTASTSSVRDDRGHAWSARAYCGPAHGHSWDLSGPPPPVVSLGVGTDVWLYRLVHHPDTGLPALDHLDNYLYVPTRYVDDG
jgi:hypothetical protein